jgi:hypothetical protein
MTININEWEEEVRIRSLLIPLTSDDGSFTKADKLEMLVKISHELAVDMVRIADATQEPRNAEELAVFREAQNAYISSSNSADGNHMYGWANKAVENYRRFRDSQS